MNDDYLISIWKQSDEVLIQKCIEEIYRSQKYDIKNFHQKDRCNENGIDILVSKGESEIGFAVKKKPGKGDIAQLETFSKKAMKKIYVYTDNPTAPFTEKMKKYPEIEFWNWTKLHEELIRHSSKTYLMRYFSVHPLIVNYSKIFSIFYNNRDAKFKINNDLTRDEYMLFWNLKDDAVKLKSMLDYFRNYYSPSLMDKIDENPEEFLSILSEVHSEFERINSLSGVALLSTLERISREYPNLLGHYWSDISQRTGWKVFASKAKTYGEESRTLIDNFILYEWVLPDIEKGTYSMQMRSFYSCMNYLIENTYSIAKDIEDGIDWVFQDYAELQK